MPTKKQTLAAIDECLVIWGEREAGDRAGSVSHDECPLCRLFLVNCSRCPTLLLGPKTFSFCPCMPVVKTWENEKDASHAIVSLCLLRAMVEDQP